MESKGSHLGSWALIVGGWLLMHGRLLTGELYWGDAGIYFYPMWEFVRRSLLTGELPFWNPYINGGQPLIGNPQMGVFYPTIVLLWGLSTERWLSLNTALHLLWAGVGMAFWLRALRCSTMACAWGACAWMGCTAVVARAQFPPFLMSIAWYPWVLWDVERVLGQPCLRNALWLGLIGALCLMAAHPQGAYLIAVVALFYVGVRLWQAVREGAQVVGARRLRVPASIQWLSVAAIMALGLSAIYWLPASVVGVLSNYSQMSLTEAERFRWDLWHLGTLLYPFLWGNPTRLYVAPGNFWEVTAYIGTLPMLLVPFGLGRGERAILRWGLGLIGLLAAWLALGTTGGLYPLAFYLLPGMRMFHDPARWLLITCLMAAALSAFGYDRLVGNRCTEEVPTSNSPLGLARGRGRVPRACFRLVFALGILICLAMAVLPAMPWGLSAQRAFLTPRAQEDHPQPSERQMLEAAQHGWREGALVVGASLGLLALAWRLSRWRAPLLWIGFLPLQLYAVVCSLPDAPPGSWAQAKRQMHAPDGRWWYPQTYDAWRRHISYLTYSGTSPQQMVQAWIPNLPMLLPASVWGAYEPLSAQRVSRVVHIVRFSRPERQTRWLRSLGIEWQATLRDAQVQFERVGAPCEAIQLVPNAVPVRDFDEMLRRFRREPANPCQRALVEGLPHALRSTGGRVQVVERRNAELRLRVRCEQPSVLIVRETLLPGWQAWIDGNPAPLYHADGVNRAMLLPAGEHTVQMRYRPPRWQMGVGVSLLSAVGWLAGWIWTMRRAGTRQESSAV